MALSQDDSTTNVVIRASICITVDQRLLLVGRRQQISIEGSFEMQETYQVQKRQSNCKIASQNFPLNNFFSTCQCKNAKKITSVASMDQNLPIEQTNFFSTSGRL